jgi:hypothetical protein
VQADPIAPAVRRPVPVARSADVPLLTNALVRIDDEPSPSGGASARRSVAAAFRDAAHAREAVILSEILAPPLALR